jgi:hypothetical protein
MDEHTSKLKMDVLKKLSIYPDRIPIFVTGKVNNTIVSIKFMSFDMQIGQFMFHIKKRIPTLNPTEALFMFLSNNTLPKQTDMLSALYLKHKDPETLFMHISISCENTFG